MKESNGDHKLFMNLTKKSTKLHLIILTVEKLSVKKEPDISQKHTQGAVK
jgi:hypothetical protein